MDKSENYNFGLVGAAGYIAPRHLKAIKDTGNNLLAALDPFDSVGIMDNYFPEAAFFTEPERFDRHMDKLRRSDNEKIDFTSICSPNFMHDSHIRMALRNQSDAICEKPLVLNPWNLDALEEIEKETGRKVYTILQLRHHPAIVALKEKVDNLHETFFDIDLTYITSRGFWYHRSWKGNIEKSGGIATNIGVHFFDMLSWIFGDVVDNFVHLNNDNRASGFLHLKKATVRWYLSVDNKDIVKANSKAFNYGLTTYRSITVNGEEIEFSNGFKDLHTLSYQSIIEGRGFTLSDAKRSINIVHSIRNNKEDRMKGECHPFIK
jgi:UDP-N-acetyl-2-amino-2-deoxyglucuronate dehydrogenase